LRKSPPLEALDFSFFRLIPSPPTEQKTFSFPFRRLRQYKPKTAS
jgi:hypothetical protein